MSSKLPPASRARSTSAVLVPASRPLILGDAPGTTEPGFPADDPAVSTVGEVLARFGLVPFTELEGRPEGERLTAALGNLDALAAVALTRGRRWQRRDGTAVVSPEPDVKGALAAQRAAHELLAMARPDKDTGDDTRPPRDLAALLADARAALSAAGGMATH